VYWIAHLSKSETKLFANSNLQVLRVDRDK
jgi:hypothetical protein